jgi:2-polyprenyl-6-methoxyphenol hydroxylase-like FAD-dependent oxidoreductase
MTKRIGIIGAGTAGLHLGLLLRQHGVEATVITDRTPDQVAAMRLSNAVAHHHVTIERERQLGVDHWPVEQFGYTHHRYCFNTPQPIAFDGRFTERSRAVDYRLYLPRLMEDFAARGGKIEFREVADHEIGVLAKQFDLIVVAAGNGPFARIFEPAPEHCPFSRPQRLLCLGLYTGIHDAELAAVTLSVSPGHGELIDLPILSVSGMVHALLMEIIPGGDLESMAHMRYDDDPKLFINTLLAKLENHHPSVYDRVDHARFDLQRPVDLLQGGIVPTVRHSAFDLGNGRMAIALGDAHAVLDPMMGQGANVASYAAWVLGEEIVATHIYDRPFCERIDRYRDERVLGAQRWTNLMTMPPGEHLLELIVAMSTNADLADEFTENFNYPERQWARLASPARIRGWIKEAAERRPRRE